MSASNNREMAQGGMEHGNMNHGSIAQRHMPHKHGNQYPSRGMEPVVFVPLMALAVIFCLRCIYRFVDVILRRRRLRLARRDPDQERFAKPSSLKAFLNRHLIHATLFGSRHHRELRSSGHRFHFGTIPTRIETTFLCSYILVNVVFCLLSVRWSKGLAWCLSDLRDTSGTLAVGNLVPLVILAGRNNPLIPLLSISFDTFNMVHRWIGRIIVAEGLIHMASVLVEVGIERGTSGILYVLSDVPIFEFGLIAILSFALIVCLSISPLRHAFYETFLHAHIALTIVALIALWYHIQGFLQRWFLFSAISCWIFERFIRFCTIIWRNFGKRFTTATIQMLPGDVTRVDISVARSWKAKAGQFVYLYLPALGLWTSHPFTVAWVEEDCSSSFHSDNIEKVFDSSCSFAKSVEDTKPPTKTISLLVRRRGGITKKLLQSARVAQGSKLRALALVEAPLGGIHSYDSYGTTVFIVGGIGITYPMTHLRDLIQGFANGSVATRKISLLWTIHSVDHLRWIQPWMTSIVTHPVLQRSMTSTRLFNPYYGGNEVSILDPLHEARDITDYFNDKQFFVQQPTLSLSIHIHITSYCSSGSSIDVPFSCRPLTNFDLNRPCWTKIAPSNIPVTISVGKPSFDLVLEREIEQQIGAMAVTVCGPGSMGDDVRQAVREAQGKKAMDFYEEAFSW